MIPVFIPAHVISSCDSSKLTFTFWLTRFLRHSCNAVFDYHNRSNQVSMTQGNEYNEIQTH